LKVLGLDQSSNINGYCLYDGEIVEYGKIELKRMCLAEADYIDRIIELIKILGIQMSEFNPDIIGLEEVTLQQDSGFGSKRNSYGALGFNTFKKLTEVVGNLKVLSRVNNVSVITVYPSEWRSVYGISKDRKLAKKEAVDIVNELFGLNLNYKDDDVAEAILIAKFIYDNKI
jgi:Holliday junction resolvasome RuvABC endonuclease subunit